MDFIQYFVNRMLKNWEENDARVLSSQQLPAGVAALCDIPYLHDRQPEHMLDVYSPEEITGRLPVIIDIHGGGFLYGKKELNKAFGYHLAKRGCLVFNLNYRLAPETKVPGQLWDIMHALLWIQRQLTRYPADEARIFLIGDSAGGVLAVMAALLLKSPRLRKVFDAPDVDLPVKALCVISGMLHVDAPSIGYWGMRSMCFAKGYLKQDTYRSMLFGKLAEMELLPPVFLVTSEEDELQKMTFHFARILRTRNVAHQLKCFEKGEIKRLGHIFPVQHPEYGESEACIEEMLAFFERYA